MRRSETAATFSQFVNILLIQLKRIGDLILTTPAISAIRQTFPDAKLTLMASREGAVLAPAITGVDNILVVRRDLSDLSRFYSVFKSRFDYCIDFTRNDRSAFLAFLSGAQKRIVSYRVKRRSRFRRGAYNEFVPQRLHDMHTIDYNLSLLEPLGINGISPPVQLSLPPDASEKAEALRRQLRIEEPFVIFHPGSARAEKFWPPDCWAEVILHATGQAGFNAVLTGGTSITERAHLAEIESKLPEPHSLSHSIIDLSGKIDLLTLACLIAQARLVVTVDTASMHLAAATRTPQVVLFGPTNPFHWYPRDSPALILQGESPVPIREFVPKQPRLPMKLISTQAVIGAMNALLSTPAAQAL
jgi:predicted lipopolysaccharide heptosyltransferase III